MPENPYGSAFVGAPLPLWTGGLLILNTCKNLTLSNEHLQLHIY
jgi:hypothetical protein